MKAAVFAVSLLGLIGASMPLRAHADEQLVSRVRFGVPMSCAAFARIQAADYPEAVRVYQEGHDAKSLDEGERAMLGLMWRHRQSIAQTLAVSAFVEWAGRSPSEVELSDEQSRWVRTLMSYPPALREAVAENCERLYALADRSCSSRPFDWSP